MKKYYVLLLATFVTFISVYGSSCLNVKGTIKAGDSSVNDIKITIFRNGQLDTLISTNDKGKFTADLIEDLEYNFIIEKRGFLSQNILINTLIDNPENYTWVYKFSTTLIPEINNIQNALLEPIALISYNAEIDEFENISVTDEALNFSEVISQYEILIYGNYEQLITKADSAFNKKDYRFAKSLYEKAAILNQYDDYADIQLYMIKRIQAQDLHIKKKYNKLIARADAFYKEEEMLKAKKHYLKAYKIEPRVYPKEQISKIKTTITLKEALTTHN